VRSAGGCSPEKQLLLLLLLLLALLMTEKFRTLRSRERDNDTQST